MKNFSKYIILLFMIGLFSIVSMSQVRTGQAEADNAIIADLINRVRILENAVAELQQQCNRQQSFVVQKTGETWTCKVTGRRELFFGKGHTRGLAEKDAMEKCYQKQNSDNLCQLKECSNR